MSSANIVEDKNLIDKKKNKGQNIKVGATSCILIRERWHLFWTFVFIHYFKKNNGDWEQKLRSPFSEEIELNKC